MTRALLAFVLLLFPIACTESPYERGLDLGRDHAQQLRAGELTFAEFTHDLNQADTSISDPTEREAFRRGYGEAIEPARRELTQLLVAELTSDAIDELGATARQLVISVRGIDRSEARQIGRDVGEFLREVGEKAEEFSKGVDEGLGKQR